MIDRGSNTLRCSRVLAARPPSIKFGKDSDSAPAMQRARCGWSDVADVEIGHEVRPPGRSRPTAKAKLCSDSAS